MSGLEKLLDSQLLASILLMIIGGIITLIFTKFSNKTGTLRYFITTNKIGMSADDQVFGSVRSTWQGHEVRNLYLSTIEIENTTSHDYENIQFKVFSGKETILLNQRTEISDTPYIVPWDKDFESRIHIPKGSNATEQQLDEYYHNREYNLPVLNRGQIIRFSYLCTNPNDDNEPNILVSTPSKGIKLKRQKLPYVVINPIFGVPVPTAIIRALVISILVVITTGLFIKNTWIAATLCMFIGLTAQIFGAFLFKAERFIKNTISG